MVPPDAGDLEARLQAILAPYEGRLEAGQIYGIHVLHRPGARAHDWFAGVRPGKGTAKLMLLPIKSNPELLEGASAALMKRRSGDALFTLRPGDDALLPELERVVARAFDVYVGTPSGGGTMTGTERPPAIMEGVRASKCSTSSAG